VLCLYDRFSDILYVMDEIVLVGVEITEMGKKVKAMVGGRPIRPKKAVVDTYANRKGGAGGKITERKILNEVTGINFVGADKADADGSRQLLSKRFSENKIVIHPNCKKTRSQIEDWVWDSNGKPVDEEDDTIDCLRYICAVLPNRPQKAPVPPEGVRSYSSEARRARMRARAELEAMKNRSANGNDHYSWQAG
jgi:hypothetical protein